MGRVHYSGLAYPNLIQKNCMDYAYAERSARIVKPMEWDKGLSPSGTSLSILQKFSIASKETKVSKIVQVQTLLVVGVVIP